MHFLSIKRLVIIILVLVAIGGGLSALQLYKTPQEIVLTPQQVGPKTEVIGASVEGRSIISYTFGTGEKQLLFVGGMHGGYEWNSVLLAYQFIEYLEQYPDWVPRTLTVTVIPSLNPDGVYAVTGKEGRFSAADAPADKQATAIGRFNAHGVDLNRNFDCKWKPESMWQGKTVSAGSSSFSEPETQALRNFVLQHDPDAVIFWHSKANAVYASECEEGILPGTLDVMQAYARASGYPSIDSFDAYEITGDAEGWLASIHIPAITVELETHETIEWEQNQAGIKALFDLYSRL